MVTSPFPPTARVEWQGAIRIIGSRHPPIDLFEDIADPEDWPLLIAMEMRTNPRILDQIGTLDMVPRSHRVSGPGSTYLMAPFTHASTDRPGRFSDGSFGVLYAGDRFEVALFETVHHQVRFMASTKQAAGWATQFQEIVLDISADLCDLRSAEASHKAALHADDYTESQRLGHAIHAAGGSGIVYPSVRFPKGQCAALFFPDLGSNARQTRHLDYHWNGTDIDYYRVAGTKEVFAIRK
jgi:hypothetical protein